MKGAKSGNSASQDAEKRGEERERPVYRPEHEIKEQRHGDVEDVRDEAYGVIENGPRSADEGLAGNCREKVKQVNDAGNSGAGARGHACTSFHQFIASRRHHANVVTPFVEMLFRAKGLDNVHAGCAGSRERGSD